jgi:hypothetical protein
MLHIYNFFKIKTYGKIEATFFIHEVMNIHVRLSRDLIFKNIFTTKKSKLLCLYPLLSTSNSFLITWLVIFISTDVKLQTEFCMEYIYNIHTLSVNIKFICASFRNRQNSEPSASFSGLFRSEYKWILYLTTMYVYCVYHAMSKSRKTCQI